MERSEIQSVVIKHLCGAVDGLEASTVDPKRSMKDLGANSLDIVEVVSSSMREIKVKIPRTELAKLTNIEQLVDLLHETKNKAS